MHFSDNFEIKSFYEYLGGNYSLGSVVLLEENFPKIISTAAPRLATKRKSNKRY